jgi:amino acid transporter
VRSNALARTYDDDERTYDSTRLSYAFDVIVYTMMTRRIPRTGGDYVWISRTFGGFWGSSFAFMGYTLETMAYL